MAAPPRPPDRGSYPALPPGWTDLGGGVSVGPISQGKARTRKPAPPPYPGYLTAEQQLALATKNAQALAQPYLDLLKQQQDRQRIAHLGQQAGLAKLYDALGGSLQGVGSQVAGAYEDAANQLGAGFDTGYSHGWEIAKRGLVGEGQGYGTSAGALPAISGQQGGVKLLAAAQQAQEEDAKLNDLITSTAAEIPAKAQAFLTDIQQSQAQLSSSYASYQQKQAVAAQQAGEKDRAYAWSVADRFTKNSDHFYVAAPDKSGRWQVVDAGPKSAAGGSSSKTFKGTDGRTYILNPDGTSTLVSGQSGPKKAAPGKPTTFQGTDGRQYTVDANGRATPIPGQPGPVTKTATKKPPTPGQIDAMVQSWYTGKKQTQQVQATNKKGKPAYDSNGNPVYVKQPAAPTGRLTYQQAYRRLRALNVPDQQARQVLDTTYKRGERGRPWVAAPQRTVLQKAGLPQNAKYDHGVAYLTPDQVAALQAAGMLPPGEKHPANGIKDRGRSLMWVYVIDPGY